MPVAWRKNMPERLFLLSHLFRQDGQEPVSSITPMLRRFSGSDSTLSRNFHALAIRCVRRRMRAMSERLTIWTLQRPIAFRTSRSFGPACPPSAKSWRGMGWRPRAHPARRHGPVSGAVDIQRDGQSGRVTHDMALAPLDPLSGIIPAIPATFRGYHAFAIVPEPCVFDACGARAFRRCRHLVGCSHVYGV